MAGEFRGGGRPLGQDLLSERRTREPVIPWRPSRVVTIAVQGLRPYWGRTPEAGGAYGWKLVAVLGKMRGRHSWRWHYWCVDCLGSQPRDHVPGNGGNSHCRRRGRS